MIRKNMIKALAIAVSASMLFLTGCDILSGNNGNVDPAGKDGEEEIHAELNQGNEVEPENTGNEETDPDKDADKDKVEQKDITEGKTIIEVDTTTVPYVSEDGFTTINPESFAGKVEGTYEIFDKDGITRGYIEIYNVANNLYGFYSGYGEAGLEFFALDMEGFASKTAESIDVKVVIFDSSDDFYRFDGMPCYVTMNITEDGLKFSNFQEGTSSLPFDENATLVKLDDEFGNLQGFAYKDDKYNAEAACKKAKIETTDIPEEVIGSWILLGDIETGLIVEFTEDGMVQMYLKNLNEPVLLARGTYACGKESVNEGTNLYIDTVVFGQGDEAHLYNFCYQNDAGCLRLVPGDEEWGTDVAWEGATFITYNVEDITRKFHDEEALADRYDVEKEHFLADDGMEIIVGGGSFLLYDAADFTNLEAKVEGTYEETPGGLNLYYLNYEDNTRGEEYGFLVYLTENEIQVTVTETGETTTFYRIEY